MDSLIIDRRFGATAADHQTGPERRRGNSAAKTASAAEKVRTPSVRRHWTGRCRVPALSAVPAKKRWRCWPWLAAGRRTSRRLGWHRL